MLLLDLCLHATGQQTSVADTAAALNYGKYKVSITTSFVNGIKLTGKQLFSPPVCNQLITFYMSDSVVKVIHAKAKNISVKYSNNHSVNIKDNVIVSVALYEKDGHVYYYFSGYGGCNTCSEYSALHNENGERLSEHYFTSHRHYIAYGKQPSDILKLIGLDIHNRQKQLDIISY